MRVYVDVLDEDDKPLVSVSPSDSLLDAIFHLSYGKVHRLLVVNPVTGNALHVLTYRRILQFIHVCVCIVMLSYVYCYHCSTPFNTFYSSFTSVDVS